jgi:hypothetical protein
MRIDRKGRLRGSVRPRSHEGCPLVTAPFTGLFGPARLSVFLQKAVMKIQPAGLYRAAGQKCPNIDYYHADLIENKHNSAALEAAIDETFSCSPGWNMRDVAERLAESAAMRVLALGDQDIRVSFATVREFVRKMIALPGQRLLMSPGFLVLTPEARAEESQIIDMAAQANVLVAFSLRLALHAKKPSRWLLAVGLFALGAIGLAPLVSSTYLQARGVYRIRVVVLGLDELPVEDARVISSSGGEPKRVASGWEFDIPPPKPGHPTGW